MIVSWDLMLHIIISCLVCGHAFKNRTYWFSAFCGLLAIAGVIAAIGSGGAA